MLWQSLVRNWVQQQARQRVMQTVAEAARGGGGGSEAESAARAARAAPCDVGLVFALSAESGGFEDLLSGVVTTKGADFIARQGVLNGRSIVIVQAGVGSLCAVRGTQALLAGHRPKWVVSAGFAGALDPSLKRGAMFMASSLVHAGSRELTVDFKISPEVLAASPGLHVGRLLTVDTLVGQSEDKLRLGQEYQAQAVDMESWNVGEVCRQAKTRFLSVRIISDAVDDVLPPEVEALARQKTTAARLGAAAGAIFRRPSSIKDMLKLKEDALRASDRLAKFLAGVIPQLAPVPATQPPPPEGEGPAAA